MLLLKPSERVPKEKISSGQKLHCPSRNRRKPAPSTMTAATAAASTHSLRLSEGALSGICLVANRWVAKSVPFYYIPARRPVRMEHFLT